MTTYITITENFQLPNRALRCRQQFVYIENKNKLADYIGNDGKIELHFVGELCEEDYYEVDGTTITTIDIPFRFSVLDTVCIPKEKINIKDWIQQRDNDKVTNYHEFVKDQLGIDMSLNYEIQRNPSKYDKDLFPLINKGISKKAYEDET
jgi:hypothetical protein